ncbi:MAG: tripartite tricarboxylate transporter substrate binding protein [Alcaligenaceae bacterium]
MKERIKRIVALLLGCFFVSGACVQAQPYPNKPIRIIVPFGPGGTTDIIARSMAKKLTEQLGISVQVENKNGGSSIVGTQFVAKAAPDGYTLLMAGSPHAINPSLRKEMPYDAVKSFEPVSLIGTVPMVLVVHPSLPVKTFQEFVAYGKKNPDALRCGVVPGSGNHMATESLKFAAEVPLMPVPYQSDAPMVVDLLGGHTNCVVLISTQGISYIREGRLIALAATSQERLPFLPNLPTLQELGLKGFLAGSWNGLFAPAGTPPEVGELIAKQIQLALKDPKIIEQYEQIGITIVGTDPQGQAKFLASDIARWRDVIKNANIPQQ